MTTDSITEPWLSSVGFKWHELERQGRKHWLLWLGECLDRYSDAEALGTELSKGSDDWWFCWLRSDTAHRYSRFLHVRHLRTQSELTSLIEGLTGQPWNPANNFYGRMMTPDRACYLRQEAERLDQRWLHRNPTWRKIEEDDTRGGALPEHMQLAIDAGKAK